MVDVAELQATVDDLRRAARDVAPHTLDSYERRWRIWQGFAQHYDIPALPAERRHVAAFVIARHQAGVSPAGIGANLSAISWFHQRLDESYNPSEAARVVLRVLSRKQAPPPVEPAPVLSVGALIAMAAQPPVLGVSFATRLIRTELADLKPRQLLTVRGSELSFGPDDAWVDVRIHAVPKVHSHTARPAQTVRVHADPGWVACPVRALRLLVSEFSDGALFDERRLARASSRSLRASHVNEGVHARIQVRDAAIVCVGYEGALRVEELSRARVEHLEPFRGGFRLHLPEAKTVRTLPRQSVFLRPREDALDPVAAIHRWLAVRGDHDGPLFTSVHHTAPSRTAAGVHVPAGDIRGILHDLAVRVGLPKTVSGYSLRRSWATHRYLEDPSSLGAISLQLRHAGLDMTVRYIEDLRLVLFEPALLLSPESIVAGPGGKREQRKDIGFDTAPIDAHIAAAERLLPDEASLAPGTLLVRESHLAVWERFAADHGLSAMPPTEEGVALFVAHRAGEQGAVTAIRSHTRSIARAAKQAGHSIPHLLGLADELLDAYARSDQAAPVAKAPVLARTELLAVAERLREEGEHRELVALTVGYSGALRIDDLRRARLDDVELAPWGALLRLRSSKDNQSGNRSETVVLLKRADALDAVSALEAFQTASGLGAGPLIPTELGAPHPASYDAIVARLQRGAAAAGVRVVPTGHSLRRSWASHAYEDGVDLVTIQRHLRHDSVRDTRGYINSLTPWVENAAAALAATVLEPAVPSIQKVHR